MSEQDHKQDWVEVVDINGGAGYDWDIFRAYYSPSARRYFWDSQCGCSCNWWEDPGRGYWNDGDRKALTEAARRWGASAEDIRDISTFKVPA